MEPKTLDNENIEQVKVNIPDVKVVGNGDSWMLLSKASSQSQGWMKSTKAMDLGSVGCLVQVTTQQRNPDGSYAIAEAITFVPDVEIRTDTNGGLKLEPIASQNTQVCQPRAYGYYEATE